MTNLYLLRGFNYLEYKRNACICIRVLKAEATIIVKFVHPCLFNILLMEKKAHFIILNTLMGC